MMSEIVANICRMLNGQVILPIVPSFRGFTGSIEEIGDGCYDVHGKTVVIDNTTVQITELPVGTWTRPYMEEVLQTLLNGTKKQPPVIISYTHDSKDDSVKLTIKIQVSKLEKLEHRLTSSN